MHPLRNKQPKSHPGVLPQPRALTDCVTDKARGRLETSAVIRAPSQQARGEITENPSVLSQKLVSLFWPDFFVR